MTNFGEEQALYAGTLLAEHGLVIDEAFTSLLCRASRTMELALYEAGGTLPERVSTSWRLNERHYGALTGLHKDEVKEKLSKNVLDRYRRDFDTPPVLMEPSHPFYTACHDQARYGATTGHASVSADSSSTSSSFSSAAAATSQSTDDIPMGESLNACHNRIVSFFNEEIAPCLKSGKTVLVAAHNNVLRSLMTHLDAVNQRSPEGKIEVPKAVPIVYRLRRDTLQPCMPARYQDVEEDSCWTPPHASIYSSRCVWSGFSATFLGDELEANSATSTRNAAKNLEKKFHSHSINHYTPRGLFGQSESSISSSVSDRRALGSTPIHDQPLKLEQVLSQDKVRQEIRKMRLPEKSIPYLAEQQKSATAREIATEDTGSFPSTCPSSTTSGHPSQEQTGDLHSRSMSSDLHFCVQNYFENLRDQRHSNDEHDHGGSYVWSGPTRG